MTNPLSWFGAIAIAITLVCSLEACRQFRHCRYGCGFERDFCIRVSLP